jgi:hypothetical protein
MNSKSESSRFIISEENGNQIVIAKADAEDAQLRAFIDAVRARKPKKADVSGIRS